MLVRLSRSKLEYPVEGPVEISIFLDLDPREIPGPDHPNLLGRFKKCPRNDPGMMVFDITAAISSLAAPGERFAFTVAVNTPGVTFSWTSVEILTVIRETGV